GYPTSVPGLARAATRVACQRPAILGDTPSVGNDLLLERARPVKHKTVPSLLRLQTGQVFQLGHNAGEINGFVIKLNLTPLHYSHINDLIDTIA
ncbi:hypothetical protein, partial [Salmonella enterica]|uniref:hypothetical protein n=1 Tax=Salmonella enterica TaxID=28901 RepID=UPI00398C7D53